MKVQVELQQVVKNVASDLTDGLLCDFGEDSIPKLLEEGGTYPGRAICTISSAFAIEISEDPYMPRSLLQLHLPQYRPLAKSRCSSSRRYF